MLRKIMAICLALALLMLCGCASENSTTPESTPTLSADSQPKAETVTADSAKADTVPTDTAETEAQQPLPEIYSQNEEYLDELAQLMMKLPLVDYSAKYLAETEDGWLQLYDSSKNVVQRINDAEFVETYDWFMSNVSEKPYSIGFNLATSLFEDTISLDERFVDFRWLTPDDDDEYDEQYIVYSEFVEDESFINMMYEYSGPQMTIKNDNVYYFNDKVYADFIKRTENPNEYYRSSPDAMDKLVKAIKNYDWDEEYCCIYDDGTDCFVCADDSFNGGTKITDKSLKKAYFDYIDSVEEKPEYIEVYSDGHIGFQFEVKYNEDMTNSVTVFYGDDPNYWYPTGLGDGWHFKIESF